MGLSQHWCWPCLSFLRDPSLQLEGQCAALHNDKHETKAENSKLRLTNQELARELERTSQQLQEAQQQLESLQREACELQQEKEM